MFFSHGYDQGHSISYKTTYVFSEDASTQSDQRLQGNLFGRQGTKASSGEPDQTARVAYACTPSEDSDQPVHSHSLLRALWIAMDPVRLEADNEDCGIKG